MLELKDVTISYKNVPTVEHFSMNMKQGQIISLVGESGSGKTTVIRAILGLLPGGGKVTGGTITFEGEDLLSYSAEKWRKLRGSDISMIFQDSGAMMNPTKKIGNVFTEYIRTHEKISKKDAWAKGITMLERMRLPAADNVMNSYPFQLSGGMTRRVLISTAVMETPKLVIADEPTPGLHMEAATRVMGHFREMADDGAGVLLITHDLELALLTADRVVVLYGGRVIEETDAAAFQNEENLKHPYTKALFRSMPKNWKKDGENLCDTGEILEIMRKEYGR